jgi:hypothetical protein
MLLNLRQNEAYIDSSLLNDLKALQVYVNTLKSDGDKYLKLDKNHYLAQISINMSKGIEVIEVIECM